MTDPIFLLDSNICIYVLRDADCAAARRLGRCEPGTVVASAITFGEVALGIDSASAEQMATLDALFRVIPVIPFGQAAALVYARLPFRRGTFDRLIAAHALALDVTIVTNNVDDFTDVPGLRVENWMQ